MAQDAKNSKNGSTVIEALITGSASSAITTVVYQPLELIKTRLQLRQSHEAKNDKLFGRAVHSAKQLTSAHGIRYLWRGTGASLLRSIPGVGLYYGSLTALQRNFSTQSDNPNNASQALFFGLTARSFVSVILLPVTVIKVRYESGHYNYESLVSAVRDSYSRTGWVGLAPTLLRDSLFSGIYYMLYTKLKTTYVYDGRREATSGPNHLLNFTFGLLSGLVASIITNPIDVIKTNMQTETKDSSTMRLTIQRLLHEEGGSARFFDGLALRSFRRTLIAATTWTLYEYLQDSIR